jgi:nucleoside-diphosphate-sugar epimerase
VAEALGALGVHLPAAVLSPLLALTWRARLQPLAPGWFDMAMATPLLDTGRARRELGWAPRIDGRTALREGVAGMLGADGTASPVLRPRSVGDQLGRLLRSGPVGRRRYP